MGLSYEAFFNDYLPTSNKNYTICHEASEEMVWILRNSHISLMILKCIILYAYYLSENF